MTGISKEVTMETKADEARRLADRFEAADGRRPRMYLAGVNADDETHLKKILATRFADMGWDVDVGPDGDTPEGAAQDASDNDVHVIGFYAANADGADLFPPMMQALSEKGRDDICAFLFGNIPEFDYETMFRAGAVAVFGPGTDIDEGSVFLLKLLNESVEE